MDQSSRDLKNKLNRFDPIVKNSQLVLDQEVMALGTIRREASEAKKQMTSKQEEYYHWLERINSIRGSGGRDMLMELEAGLDTIKEQCFVFFKRVHQLKQREMQQLEVIERCRLDVSAKEKLRGRYQDQYAKKRDSEETKAIDEITSLRYARRES